MREGATFPSISWTQQSTSFSHTRQRTWVACIFPCKISNYICCTNRPLSSFLIFYRMTLHLHVPTASHRNTYPIWKPPIYLCIKSYLYIAMTWLDRCQSLHGAFYVITRPCPNINSCLTKPALEVNYVWVIASDFFCKCMHLLNSPLQLKRTSPYFARPIRAARLETWLPARLLTVTA